MQIGVEKINTHEGISMKALLNSGATGLFMSKKCAERGGFKLIKLGKPIVVKNVDSTGNSGSAILHEVEVNLYFKGHIEKSENGCVQSKKDRSDIRNALVIGT